MKRGRCAICGKPNPTEKVRWEEGTLSTVEILLCERCCVITKGSPPIIEAYLNKNSVGFQTGILS